MPAHEQKTCPRCAGLFECKVGDIGNCQCSGIRLTGDVKAHIEGKYNDCLCRHCLEQLMDKASLFNEKFFPK